MPLRAHHLPQRSIAPDRSTRAVADVPFEDLVYLLAAGIADAQTALDTHTAETLETLIERTVDVIPKLTRTIEKDGTIATESAPMESRSLLELGLSPARYQFSDATIEVEIDVSVTDEPDRQSDFESQSRGTRGDDETEQPLGLRADTQAGRAGRRFGREFEANARFAARLEPTPLPTRLGSPTRREPVIVRGETDGGPNAY